MKNQTTLYFTQEQKKKLKAESKRTGISMSSLIKQMINTYFERREHQYDD